MSVLLLHATCCFYLLFWIFVLLLLLVFAESFTSTSIVILMDMRIVAVKEIKRVFLV